MGSGASAEEIAEFTGAPALEPVRAYAGLESAPTTEARAALAVDDLARAGGFDRGLLVVVTTTGSGWVDPGSVDSVEYLTGGDSAAVAMQYSYLPSWMSYLVDQDRARESGRELFDAVYDRWSKLPLDDRPRLVVVGREPGLVRRGDRLQRRVRPAQPDRRRGLRRATELQHALPRVRRRPGRRESRGRAGVPGRPHRAVHGRPGRGRPARPSRPWDGSRVLYLLHASDPIVVWSPQLLYARPDWLEEARGTTSSTR